MGPTTAFTLLELLVVIAIIAILATMLLPALSKAKGKGLQAQCFGNEHQIGLAFMLYAEDSQESYPYHAGFAAFGGQRPSVPYTGAEVNNVGSGQWETNRPLNHYAPALGTFHCPADRGDGLIPAAKSCWDGWGNSYLVEWAYDFAGTKHVTGDSSFPGRSPAIKTTEVARRAATKLILGDWPWHPNRDVNDPHNDWHNCKGRRWMNILFGDGHVVFWHFPAAYDTDPKYKSGWYDLDAPWW